MIARADIRPVDILRKIVGRSIGSVKPSALFGNGFSLHDERLHAFGEIVDFPPGRNVRCVAIGKAAEAMAAEVSKILGHRVKGIIATPVDSHLDIHGFEFHKTGHPYPDNCSVSAGDCIRDFVRSCDEKDLLLFLISGGGSASVFVPVDGITLSEANSLFELLMRNAVPISDINLNRRHLSALGGGKLAALAPGIEKLSLIISDVVGDDPVAIASGPTVEDNSTPADALRFIEGSGLIERVPRAIISTLERLAADFTPVRLEKNIIRIIASNRDALRAAEAVGTENLFNTIILNSSFSGTVSDAAEFVVSIAADIELNNSIVAPPALVLLGGETVVSVSGNGRGGRNQHLVLTALSKLASLMREGKVLSKTTVFAFGTDGKDGNSDAAGAFASLEVLRKVKSGELGLKDFLTGFDSNSFFKEYGGLIETGPTDTNVMDVFGLVVE